MPGFKIFSLSIAICAGIWSVSAASSTSDAGRVSNTIVNSSGRFFFDHNGTRSARPSCSHFNRWVVDITTSTGQAMMALVLTAQSQSKIIVVNGSGSCADWPDTEGIDHIIVP